MTYYRDSIGDLWRGPYEAVLGEGETVQWWSRLEGIVWTARQGWIGEDWQIAGPVVVSWQPEWGVEISPHRHRPVRQLTQLTMFNAR